MSRKTVVLCSSANFYKHVVEVAVQLEKLGFNAVIPETARQMRETGNYDVDAVRTWYKNSDDFHIKTHKMRAHFDEISKGDIVLLVNDEKRRIKGYVGPNGLMELGLAFYLNKPIYVLNAYDKTMPYYEEIEGMNCKVINGDLGEIK